MAATRTPSNVRVIPVRSAEPREAPAAPQRATGRLSRAALIALSGFLGVTAAAGGLALLVGWIAPGEDLLEGSPFSSYVIPGLTLLVVVGGNALLAAAATLRRHTLAAPVSAVAGLTIVAYEVVEFTVIGFHGLQLAYGAAGVLIVALAVRLWILRRRLG